MPDVFIKVSALNPHREYSVEVKGLDDKQLPDYVAKTYRDLVDLLHISQINIEVSPSQEELLVEANKKAYHTDL